MLVNGHVSWNMSAKLKEIFRTTIDNSTWRMYVAKLMLNWRDPMVECERTILLPVLTDNHFLKPISKSSKVCVWCVVCGLKTNIQKILELNLLIFVTIFKSHDNLYQFKSWYNCTFTGFFNPKNFFFKIPQFVGLSCFKIAHHELSMGLFSVTSSNSATIDIQTCSKSSQQQKSAKTSHLLCNIIYSLYLSWDSRGQS